MDSLDGMLSGSLPSETAKGDTMNTWLGGLLAVMALTTVGPGEKPLYVARPLTQPGEFTKGIEGPSCDRAGDIYAVNFAREQTVGKVTPDGRGEVFVTLPGRSVGNGIVFDSRGRMYVADYVGHNVLRIDPETRAVEVFARAAMHQPNDLAIAPDGTLYASDPDWANGRGQLWKVSTSGGVERVAADMGTTNGVEVSPDGKWLYVNESIQRNVWKFPVKDDGTLGEKRLIRRFPDHGFDGMRCDVDGNLYITRHGKGTVVIMTPEGRVLREVDVLGKYPTNLCFGGPDGRTVYVTEAEHTRLVTFRVERPGLAWQRHRPK
jgi:sugar lactone lactonase YvrE